MRMLGFVGMLAIACGSTDAIVPAQDASTDQTSDAPITQDSGTKDTSTNACTGITMGPTGTLTGQKIQAAGQARTYVITIPANADTSHALSIVFAWHGDGGTGSGLRSQLKLEAEAKDKAIFVYPDGLSAPYGSWDLESGPPNNRDIALFDAIVTEASTKWCVDNKRVFSTGFSRGGFFTNHLACFRGDKLAAIAPQSGGGPYWPNTAYNADGQLACPTPPVPALIIHGNADNTVPNDKLKPDGGWQSYFHWAYWNHASPRAGYDFASDPTMPSPCQAARGLPADHPVIACFIDGLDHATWSQEAPTVWAFFQRF